MYYRRKNNFEYKRMIGGEPNAIANVRGGSNYPAVGGKVEFYHTPFGVLVSADIHGLPVSQERCGNDIFAFHIHGGELCSGNNEDEFADAGTHYNPDGCPHPYHRGDMPPLFTSGKKAFLSFLTDRFTVDEIIGKTVIIHDKPDDFTNQPSGNSGMKIACGEIEYYK